MPFQLAFNWLYKYDSLESGITLETALWRGDRRVVAKAKIDTGAEVCLFSREIGEKLGIKIENGVRLELGTLTGTMTAYGHEVSLDVLGLTIHTLIYFSENRKLPRNLLGRQGWLQLIRLAIIDYDQELYLSAYHDPM